MHDVALEQEIFAVTMPVRWGDQDAYGHVNNVSYFRYLEEVRVQWMRQCGIFTDGDAVRPVAVTAGATFLKSIEYPATVTVTIAIGAVGRSSVTLAHRIIDAEDAGVIYGEGYAKLVWTDTQSGKSIVLPEQVLQQLQVAKRSAKK